MEKAKGSGDEKPTTSDRVNGKFFTFFVDDKEFQVAEPTITGGQIMDLAGIDRNVGLVQVLDDGTQRQVLPDEVIKLEPGRRFKKAPRFKGG